MQTLIFATHNPNKVKEIKALTKESWNILSLEEIGFFEDIPEPFDTLEANAQQKAKIVYEKTGKDCFSEDTGLEVESLNMKPGVLSARYAGAKRSAEDNMNLLLENLKGKKERKAQFRTVISFLYKGEERQFEGICKGQIIEEKRGNDGFGYDPIFVPEGDHRTFAEMNLPEKAQYSHRAKAFEQFVNYLHEMKI